MRQQAGIPARMTVVDETGAMAQLTGAQYGQVMGAYGAFQHRLKTSIIPVYTETARISSGAVQMRSSFGVVTVRVTVALSKQKPGTIIVDADFIIITYGFTSDDGRDLDTRTRLVSPVQSADYIGWRRGRHILSDGSLSVNGDATGAVVTWGGDNVGYGVESVFIDIKKIKSIHGNSPISFECRAFWYGKRLRGDCNFLVKVYKGGEIESNGFDFISVDGNLVAKFNHTKNITTNIGLNVVGDLVAVMSFDPSNNQLTLT